MTQPIGGDGRDDTREGAEVGEADGRTQRRLRNIDAVRTAILSLLGERRPMTVSAIVERSGVADRSIYRYYGDLDAAVEDAQQVCYEAVMEFSRSRKIPSANLSVEQRIEELLEQRFALEEIGRPLRYTRQQINPDLEFDAHVISTFLPELAALDPERRRQVSDVVAWALRPRAIRSHLDSGNDERWTRETIRYSVLSALAQA